MADSTHVIFSSKHQVLSINRSYIHTENNNWKDLFIYLKSSPTIASLENEFNELKLTSNKT